MYHSRNYCKMLQTIYPIFIVIHRARPESDVMTFWCFSPLVYCVWSQTLIVSVVVTDKGWKYV